MKAGDVEVRLTDGPALVRGASVVRDHEGDEHRVRRPVVAVCLCGKSGIRPWCDGTHKFLARSDAGPGPEEGPEGESDG